MRLALFTFLLLSCLSRQVSYTHKLDADAVTASTRVWSGAGMTLTLCEDLAAEATTMENDCQIDHVAMSGDRGAMRSENAGGCGGCPEANVVLVKGTLDGKAIEGMVDLGTMYDHDPYAFPYTVDVHCVDPNPGCSFRAQLQADGSLTGMPGDAAFTMMPTGPATCQ